MFEIHLTVQTDDIGQFKSDCEKANAKAVVIELQNRAAKSIQMDVMTSSKFKDGNAVTELRKLTSDFQKMGYKILRKKIEVHPDHYNIKRVTNGDYFESHIRILVNKTTEPDLRKLCANNNFHLSRNIFKQVDDENYYLMATLRLFDTTIDNFKNKVNDFISKLVLFSYDKIEIECCVFDSNHRHDSAWINDYLLQN